MNLGEKPELRNSELKADPAMKAKALDAASMISLALQHLEAEIEHGLIPEMPHYFVENDHMLTDQFEATLAQSRRIAAGESLLHGESVLLHSEHAKRLGTVLVRLMSLVDMAPKRLNRDAVLESLLIRVMRGHGEAFQTLALDLVAKVRKSVLG